MATDALLDARGGLTILFERGTLAPETDARLLDIFLDSDHAAAEAAFTAIVARHGARVRRVCLDVLGHSEDAEDASQAVFLILARRANSVRRRGSISSWLHGTARHVALRTRRENDRRRHREQRWAVSKGKDLEVSDAMLSMLFHEDLHRELDHLPEIDRLPIILYHMEGLSHAEAAARLVCPLRTFQSRLLRARTRLRDRLRRAGLEPALIPAAVLPIGWADAVARSTMAFATTGSTPTAASTLATRVLEARSAGRIAFGLASLLVAVFVAGAAAISNDPGRKAHHETAIPDPINPPRQEAPNRKIQLRVVDRNGSKPIKGVWIDVTADSSSRFWFIDVPGGVPQGETDAGGHCRLDFPERLPPAIRIDAHKPGYASRTHVIWNHSSRVTLPAGLTMELEQGAKLGGIVRNHRGEPIAGAAVVIRAISQPDESPSSSSLSSMERTDANGRWHVVNAPPRLNFISLRIESQEYLPNSLHFRDDDSAFDRLRKETFETILDDGILCSGRVVTQSGRPVAGVNVFRGELPEDFRHFPIITDTNGGFRVRLGRETELLAARPQRDSPAIAEANADSAGKPIEIRLGPRQRLSGRVVDQHGNPLEGVMVDITRLKGYRTLNTCGRTDRDGRFILSYAPAEPITLGFSREGFAPLSRDGFQAGKPMADIVMHPPLRVRGKVTDAKTGEPIPRFTILDGHYRNDFPGEPDPKLPEWSREEPRREFTDGEYEIEYAHPYLAAVAVRIEAEGHLPATSGRLSITAGEVVFDARLKPGVGPSGVVHGRDGQPLAGADVVLWSHDEQSQSYTSRSKTDDHGAFHFPPQAGRFDLLVTHPSGFAEVRESDAEPGRLLKLTVEPWSRVEGIVKIGMKPAADETVMLFEVVRQDRAEEVILRGLQGQSTKTDTQGRYGFDRVLPGLVEVSRSRPLDRSRFGSARFATQRATTEPARTVRVDIGGGGRPVVGRFVIPAGIDPAAVFPVQGQQLVRVGSESDQAPQATLAVDTNVRPDGSFRIDDVSPGRYRLRAEVHAAQDVRRGRPGPKFAVVDVQVIVPGASGGPPEKPLDLGSIALKPVPPGSP